MRKKSVGLIRSDQTFLLFEPFYCRIGQNDNFVFGIYTRSIQSKTNLYAKKTLLSDRGSGRHPSSGRRLQFRRHGQKPVPEPATLTAPALTLSADAVLVDPERSDQPALHAEWTAATDDEQTEVAYTLYVNLTGRDMFSGPVVIDKGAALTHDFTHGELNQLLLNTFDLEAGAEAAVRFAVYAKNADEEFDAQLSEIISCAITPKTTYPNFPPSLIMVGAATPWQWDLNAGLELPESREGSHLYQASGVELRVQPMSLNNGFKFYFSRNVNDTDDPRFAAQDLSAETFGKIAVYKSGEAQFQPGSFGYENGVYDIEVNLNTMKMTLTAKSIDYSTAYSMTGEATPGGWESRTYRPKKGDNEWEATGVAMNFDGDYKGFKIFASSDGWWPWYGQTPDAPFGTVIRIDDQATSDAKGAPQFYPSRFGYASGTYTINLNLNTMPLTLTKEN